MPSSTKRRQNVAAVVKSPTPTAALRKICAGTVLLHLIVASVRLRLWLLLAWCVLDLSVHCVLCRCFFFAAGFVLLLVHSSTDF
jgi:hypothetical protein